MAAHAKTRDFHNRVKTPLTSLSRHARPLHRESRVLASPPLTALRRSMRCWIQMTCGGPGAVYAGTPAGSGAIGTRLGPRVSRRADAGDHQRVAILVLHRDRFVSVPRHPWRDRAPGGLNRSDGRREPPARSPRTTPARSRSGARSERSPWPAPESVGRASAGATDPGRACSSHGPFVRLAARRRRLAGQSIRDVCRSHADDFRIRALRER